MICVWMQRPENPNKAAAIGNTESKAGMDVGVPKGDSKQFMPVVISKRLKRMGVSIPTFCKIPVKIPKSSTYPHTMPHCLIAIVIAFVICVINGRDGSVLIDGIVVIVFLGI